MTIQWNKLHVFIISSSDIDRIGKNTVPLAQSALNFAIRRVTNKDAVTYLKRFDILP